MWGGHLARLRLDTIRDLENPSPNLSPARREALNFPPSLVGKGVRGLGFPHNQKSPDEKKAVKSHTIEIGF
ncbi:MAG: hypothetical protein EA343_16240 [Nodularia sp. (in: Bacteria)]|nr:MAG: hypothetical protein EA343_16240 [Nodularia sp. (in: cyanobacteria)]